jgi:hypothetical protein
MREFWGAKGQLGGSRESGSGRKTHYPVCLLEKLVGRIEAKRLCWGGLMALEEGVKRRGQVGHAGTILGDQVGQGVEAGTCRIVDDGTVQITVWLMVALWRPVPTH